jgi:hypothetical protein
MKRTRSGGNKQPKGGGTVAAKRQREAMDEQSEHPGEHSAGASSASASGSRGAHVESFLVKVLLYAWSWGFISLVFVQKVCAAAAQDFEAQNARPPKDLSFMAQIGSRGAYPGNMHKQVTDHFPSCELGRPSYILLPLKIGKDVVAPRLQGIIMPHMLFAKIFQHYKEAWQQYILPSEEALMGFWDAMVEHPIFSIVGSREGGYRDCLIPLALHGDDVPVTGVGKSWQKLITVFSCFFFKALLLSYTHYVFISSKHTFVFI